MRPILNFAKSPAMRSTPEAIDYTRREARMLDFVGIQYFQDDILELLIPSSGLDLRKERTGLQISYLGGSLETQTSP